MRLVVEISDKGAAVFIKAIFPEEAVFRCLLLHWRMRPRRRRPWLRRRARYLNYSLSFVRRQSGRQPHTIWAAEEGAELRQLLRAPKRRLAAELS